MGSPVPSVSGTVVRCGGAEEGGARRGRGVGMGLARAAGEAVGVAAGIIAK